MKGHYHVRVENKKEKREAIAFLEKRGFENVQNLTEENYHFPILIVRENYFMGTNTTCMACALTRGGSRNKILAWNEFQAILSKKTLKIGD